MNFYNYSFLFAFLPLTLVIYFLAPAKWRNGWLLIASLVFYAFADYSYAPVLIGSLLINFGLGFALGRARAPAAKKFALALSVIFNLALLGLFKYRWMVADTLRLAPGFPSFYLARAALPLGISFYTFKNLSYLIDIYRGRISPSRSFIDFASYLAAFPQIVAGPIARYSEFGPQMRARTTDSGKFADGLSLIFVGLAKKILLADTAKYFCDPLFALQTPGLVRAWMSALLFSAQIYFDFSGYSDIAIGLGLMLGFETPQNFNSPYKAATFADFWRRWHMTLSRFLRDYLYISLGGNRKGRGLTYANLMITMLLGGLWHGASWNFVIWGGYHGILLSLERLFGVRAAPQGKIARAVRTAFTFIMAALGWGVFFRIKDFSQSLRWLNSLFFFDGLGPLVSWPSATTLVALLAIIFGFKNSWEMRRNYRLYWVVFIIICFVLSLVVAFTKGSAPFLYARF